MHWRTFLLLSSCLLLFTACAHTELPTPATSPPPQSTAMLPTPWPSVELQETPAQIGAKLATVDALSVAVAQLAAVLSVPPSQIAIRIRSKDCTVCNLAENGAQSQPPLLPLADAEETLSAYDLLWLVAQPLSCSYYFDGKTFTPRGCQVDE
ncbi:MAG: hypothetical protein KDE53_07240 [Caldilineaceae bacterium]|nr:hypothetical protein [Caldilineaceae bacterium]